MFPILRTLELSNQLAVRGGWHDIKAFRGSSWAIPFGQRFRVGYSKYSTHRVITGFYRLPIMYRWWMKELALLVNRAHLFPFIFSFLFTVFILSYDSDGTLTVNWAIYTHIYMCIYIIMRSGKRSIHYWVYVNY